MATIISGIFKFPLPYWQPQPSPPNYSPNSQPFLDSPFILGGMKHLLVKSLKSPSFILIFQNCLATIVSGILKFPLPYWQPQLSPPNYSPNPQGMKQGMKHFPKAKGRVRNILFFSVVGYETFPPLTMKTLQQGMQVKKWTAPNPMRNFMHWSIFRPDSPRANNP